MDLETAYAYPPGKERWVRANMVTAVDGLATLDQQSATLSGAADKKVFGILRALCDVVLVGAGTARAESYEGVRIGPRTSRDPCPAWTFGVSAHRRRHPYPRSRPREPAVHPVRRADDRRDELSGCAGPDRAGS